MSKSEEKTEETNGSKDTSSKDISTKKSKLPVQVYVYAGIFIVAFVLGLLLSNAMSSGKVEDITTQNKAIIDSLQQEKAQLKTEKETAVEKQQELESEVETLQTRLSSTQADWINEINAAEAKTDEIKDMLNALVTEGPQVRREVKEYYELQWPRYLVLAPGETKTATVTVENTGIGQRDFDVDVRIDAKYLRSFDDAPADGSLTLDKGGSGNINLKFQANEAGFAVFGIYVNSHYAGDIVGFVVE